MRLCAHATIENKFVLLQPLLDAFAFAQLNRWRTDIFAGSLFPAKTIQAALSSLCFSSVSNCQKNAGECWGNPQLLFHFYRQFYLCLGQTVNLIVVASLRVTPGEGLAG